MNSRLLILLFLLAASLVMGGCSDEPYGSLICPPGPRDTLVVYPRLEYQQVTVTERGRGTQYDDAGMGRMQSLYLGSSEEARSDILVNFDFQRYRWNNSSIPDSLLDLDNIKGIYLSLKRLRPYLWTLDSEGGDLPPIEFYYHVRFLEAPFAPRDYEFAPGPVPNSSGPILNPDFHEGNDSIEPRIRLYPDSLIDLIRDGETVGLSITVGSESDSALVGFASQELTAYSQINPLYVGSVPAPTISVEFRDGTLPNLLIPPINDTSTFEQVTSLPPDLIHVQTGLRSYPVLAFDIPPIPSGSCIDKLGFRVSPVTTSPLWENDCLYLTYLDSTRYDWSDGSITEGTYYRDRRLFQVCPDPQATDGYLGSGPEVGYVGPLPKVMHLMFNFPDPTIDYMADGHADIYFSQSTFHGPDAAPELRPALLVITGPKGD